MAGLSPGIDAGPWAEPRGSASLALGRRERRVQLGSGRTGRRPAILWDTQRSHVATFIPVVATLCLAGALSACAAARSGPPGHSAARSAEALPTPVEPSRIDKNEQTRPAPDSPSEAPSTDAGAANAEGRPRGWSDLSIPGFEPAVLWVPEPGARPRPVLVVAHGAGGDARWHCELYAQRMHTAAYILCPRGVRMVADRRVESGYYFPDHRELEREVMTGLEALWSSFADADRTGIVYAGYSQGATMGALMIVDHAERFQRLALVEGGTGEWDLARAKRFRRGGGQRVLFACGRARCRDAARRSARWLEQAGLAVRVEYAPGAGHTPAGGVGEKVARAFGWLTEGDPRWEDSR
jgi:predicted esterase